MISMDKKYKTRDRQDVRVLCVDAPGVWPVVAIVDRCVRMFAANGKFTVGTVRHHDLVEVSERDDFKIDEPVMVRDFLDGKWNRGTFSGVNESGKPTIWVDGTKWTSNGERIEWNFCRRPTEEELK